MPPKSTNKSPTKKSPAKKTQSKAKPRYVCCGIKKDGNKCHFRAMPNDIYCKTHAKLETSHHAKGRKPNPAPPKRKTVLSPFFRFMNENRDKLKEMVTKKWSDSKFRHKLLSESELASPSHPEAPKPTHIAKFGGTQWKALSDDEKEPYIKATKHDQAKLPKRSPKKKKEGKLTAFFAFSKEKREETLAELQSHWGKASVRHALLSPAELAEEKKGHQLDAPKTTHVAKKLGHMWKALSDAQKEKYKHKAQTPKKSPAKTTTPAKGSGKGKSPSVSPTKQEGSGKKKVMTRKSVSPKK